jgi:TRIAD3 protein (E3 ubiquitin-protein ligase RNF216)
MELNKYHYYHCLMFMEEVTGRKAILDYYERFHGIRQEIDLTATSTGKSPLGKGKKKDFGLPSYNKQEITIINTTIAQKQKERATSAAPSSSSGSSSSSSFSTLSFPTSLIKTRQTMKGLPLPSNTIDEILANEIEFLKKIKTNEMIENDIQLAKQLNNEDAIKENAIFECQCCYNNELSFEELIQCTEGDLFCKSCLSRYIEEMIFGNSKISHRLKCMNSMGTTICQGFYLESMIKKSLPSKIFEKYSEMLLNDSLRKAEINNLISCYSCCVSVEMSENSGNILCCIACNAQTCRLCKEESHIPLKCSEVEKKKDTLKRLSVEEAMAEARIRECPTCKKRFYKTEGCNKMTCTCGTMICYLCRKNVTKEKYGHFCQIPHCQHQNCGKCLLYSNSVDDDRKAMLEAGLKAIEENKNNETDTTTEESKEKDETKVNCFLSRLFC